MKTLIYSFLLLARFTVQIQCTSTSSKISSTFTTIATPTPSATYHNASYDDLASTPLGAAPVVNKVPTPYNDLLMQGFSVLALNTANSLLAPNSPANAAGSGLALQTTSGPPAFKVNYTGSSVKSFDLKTIYLGCVVFAEGVVKLPTGCTVQFTGKTTTGATVFQLVNYAPNTLLGDGTVSTTVAARMTQGVFPSSFSNLVEVDFAVTNSVAAASVTVLLIDNAVFYTR